MDFRSLFRPGILNTKPYTPGKPISEVQRELGITNIVKLASNENPEGPPAAVIKALQKVLVDLNRYPDAACYELTKALAAKLSVAPRSLIFGNGSNEVLDMFIRALVSPGENVVFAHPSFIVYPLTTGIHFECGRAVPLTDDDKHDLQAMLKSIDERTKLCIICNPNNPTGTYNTTDEFRAFMQAMPGNVIVFVDEAYYEYVVAVDYPQTLAMLAEFPNLVIGRTFSKIHSLAGLRIGYAVGHPDLIAEIQKTREPFNVNMLSQVAAVTILGLAEETNARVQRNRENLKILSQGLVELGMDVTPSQANFILVRCQGHAAELTSQLLERGVIVRPMSIFGLGDGAIRISVGNSAENEKCLAALREILS